MKSKSTWQLYIDGAARNNPGPAGAGIYLVKDGQTAAKEYFYLGHKTNNQAEYLALVLGLFFLHQYAKPDDVIRIISDSLLLVQQLNGKYRVKHPNIKPLHAFAQMLLKPLQVDIIHVRREDNTEADLLANKGIDSQKKVPESFIDLLSNYAISFTYE